MSFHNTASEETRTWSIAGHLSNYELCFVCGASIQDWFVYWHGCTGSIALHEACADRLGIDLLKDASCVRLEQR